MRPINKIKTINKVALFSFLLSFSWLLACSQQQVNSQTETSTDKSLSPYFMVLTEESETEQLPLKNTRVDVNIAGVIADVQVKQVYSNTGKKTLEAIYVFPASTRAAVYNMVMKINDREIIALVEEKLAARQMYEQAKEEGKTASLLEEQRPNVFQMNVANIMPGATVEVTLSYTELLVPTDKIYEFVYPTVVGPRYVSAAEQENQVPENWTSNPYLEEGTSSTYGLDLKVNLSTGIPIKEIRCETHKNNVNYTGKNKAEITLDDSKGGNRDFVLQYRLSGNQVESGVLTYKDANGENYFLAMMQPPERITADQIPPREYVFIVDVSGSMSGFPLEVSKTIMSKLLNSLKTTDKFNIVCFAGGSSVYAKESVTATKDNISNAIQYMNSLNGGGGTELLNALKNAMNLGTADNYARSFVILTDGYVSVEKQTFDYIRENLGNANFFSFGIGSSVNRFLIEGMAHVGKAEAFVALNKEDAEKQAFKFIKYISNPVLTQINYSMSGTELYDVIPEKVPDLFAERPIILTGKIKNSISGNINITGTSGNNKYSETLQLDNINTNAKNKALKYLWAREKIRLLSDYNNIQQDNETKSEIIALGKQYNLLTEYTSFIAVDSEISNTTGQSSTVKQPLPLPQGVSNNAVGYSGNTGKRYSMKSAVNTADIGRYAPVQSMDMVIFEEDAQIEDEEVFIIVEQMPNFNGGDLTEFQKYIQANIQYPVEAQDAAISGKVFVQFVVDENGKVVDVKVIRSVDKLLDEEALRVIKASPNWTPGIQRGKPVRVQFVIPVVFKLN
ncbi:MAG: TonB family protein [Bacteroidales bacterium]|nr:TonB family protein [Bacteroidales bacterium]MBN2818382.1 TonB family protein [Bacteroidales bacterium]